MEKRIRIYLVDDHKIFVKGVATILESEEDMEVMGFTYDGESVLEFLKFNEINILLTDVNMPGMSGIELTAKVKSEFPDVKVIGLSMFDNPEIIRQLIGEGAEGYLLKDVEKKELTEAIRAVNSGTVYYSSGVAKSLLESSENKDLLTRREKEIIGLIAAENTNVQIAEKLFISEHTVETHRKNIFRKTKAKSIVGLVKFAYENKLI